jgi:integration host factor subunit beta
MRNMTIADVIQELTERIGVTPRESEIIVRATYDIIQRALLAGETFEIRGFGRFSTRLVRPSTRGKSRTSTSIQVPAQRVPYFKASKELKHFVNFKSPAPEVSHGLEI